MNRCEPRGLTRKRLFRHYLDGLVQLELGLAAAWNRNCNPCTARSSRAQTTGFVEGRRAKVRKRASTLALLALMGLLLCGGLARADVFETVAINNAANGGGPINSWVLDLTT